MSSVHIAATQRSLEDALRALVPLKAFGPGVKEKYETDISNLSEAITDLARAMAAECLDREFNRGDWRY